MKMILPPDWDRPSPDNDSICEKFARKVYRAGNDCLRYRLFAPDKAGGAKVSLVLYLHDADAAGDDNNIQLSMHDIGTYLARDDMQRRYPCYILAPQYASSEHWSIQNVKDALWKLVTDTAQSNPDIDANRIYVYGYSAGGVGTLRLVKEHPGFFAAAVSICGATGTWDLDNLLKIPLWMTHAADDTIVKAVYRTRDDTVPGNLGSNDIYNWYLRRSKEVGEGVAEMRYTEYPKGFMKEHYGVNPHCSWVVLSDPSNTEVWEWMFSKRLGA